jgi:hypothetical protein
MNNTVLSSWAVRDRRDRAERAGMRVLDVRRRRASPGVKRRDGKPTLTRFYVVRLDPVGHARSRLLLIWFRAI